MVGQRAVFWRPLLESGSQASSVLGVDDSFQHLHFALKLFDDAFVPFSFLPGFPLNWTNAEQHVAPDCVDKLIPLGGQDSLAALRVVRPHFFHFSRQDTRVPAISLFTGIGGLDLGARRPYLSHVLNSEVEVSGFNDSLFKHEMRFPVAYSLSISQHPQPFASEL